MGFPSLLFYCIYCQWWRISELALNGASLVWFSSKRTEKYCFRATCLILVPGGFSSLGLDWQPVSLSLRVFCACLSHSPDLVHWHWCKSDCYQSSVRLQYSSIVLKRKSGRNELLQIHYLLKAEHCGLTCVQNLVKNSNSLPNFTEFVSFQRFICTL